MSRLSMIVRVNVVLNRTVDVVSDWRFDNLCGSHPQSESEFTRTIILNVIMKWLLSSNISQFSEITIPAHEANGDKKKLVAMLKNFSIE